MSTEPSIENPQIARRVIYDALLFAGLLLGVGLGAVAIRFVLDRIFAAPADHARYFGSVIFSVLAGITWFFLSFFFLTRSGVSRTKVTPDSQSKSSRQIGPDIALAICISLSVALTLWLAVDLNDEIFESRSLPWISPLITFQEYGIGQASRLFPCRMEGSDFGCEAYKFLPVMLIANAVLYFPFVLTWVFLYRKSTRAKRLIGLGARAMSSVAPPAVSIGLILLLAMHGWGRATQDSLYPGIGDAHWHFGIWELVNDVTGTIIVVAGVLVPFYTFRACRRSDGREIARARVRELTTLVAVLLLALLLGNVYSVSTGWRLVL